MAHARAVLGHGGAHGDLVARRGRGAGRCRAGRLGRGALAAQARRCGLGGRRARLQCLRPAGMRASVCTAYPTLTISVCLS